MLVALISYILLQLFLARAKAQIGTEVDNAQKAEIVAKVQRITDVIDFVIAIWFKMLLGLAIIIAILVCIAIFGIAFESATITAIEILEFGTIAQLVSEFGTPTVISTLVFAVILLIGIPYLLMRFFSKRKEKVQK